MVKNRVVSTNLENHKPCQAQIAPHQNHETGRIVSNYKNHGIQKLVVLKSIFSRAAKEYIIFFNKMLPDRRKILIVELNS